MSKPLRWLLALGVVLLVVGLVAAVGARVVSSDLVRPQNSVPDTYRALVVSSAARCPQLPASVLAAQIATESGWNPKAVSGAGAEGIAQFIPQTWKDYGIDANGDGIKDVFDPEDAIPSAATFMCRLFDEVKSVKGDPLPLALAAYNAGPSRVRKYGGIPPFPETQRYVRLILERAADPDFVALDR